MRRWLFLPLTCVWAAAPAWGQTAAGDHTEVVKALLERIEKLERRVQELESKLDASAAPALTPVKETSAVDHALHEDPIKAHAQEPKLPAEQVAAARDQASFPSLQLRGFADVDFAAIDQPGKHSGFNLGQFVLHVASPLSKKVSYFGELSFTAQPTGYAVEVERTVIRYDYNDYFKMSFGRYHMPVNYWNTAFHHGLWLQTTISRPEMVQFGGKFIPVHFVGLLAEGRVPSGGLGLSYNVGAGNGRGAIIGRSGDAGDVNNNRAWLINIFARPARFRGLQFGGAVYRDKLSPTGGPELRELITSAHLVWTRETPEFLAEFANVHHRDIATGKVFNSQAFYVQLAYRLPWLERQWKPYYRFEYINTPSGEPVLPGLDLISSTLGVRYDISEFAAFKTEWRNFRREPGTPRTNGLFLQTSFTF